MRIDVRIVKVGETKNTSKFELLGEAPPMKEFYVNTEKVSSLPSAAEELLLTISSEPLAAGEVALKFAPLPFSRDFKDVVRYQHTIEGKGKGRRKNRPAPNTPDLPVNLEYVNRAALDDGFIAEKRPIYFGLSAADHKIDPPDAIAAFDAFLRKFVRVKRGGRLTSRQIWAVWAARWGANPDERVIEGVQLADVARRFRAVFGATAVKKPTRIDGISQRYWQGFTITAASA